VGGSVKEDPHSVALIGSVGSVLGETALATQRSAYGRSQEADEREAMPLRNWIVE
jgi:hypothetical protein